MPKTIAVSDEAYKRVLAKKQEMEREGGDKVIPMASAVDALLEEQTGK